MEGVKCALSVVYTYPGGCLVRSFALWLTPLAASWNGPTTAGNHFIGP